MLPDDYLAACEQRARRFSGCWDAGTSGSLAADVMRLLKERRELMQTLEERNRDIREAVAARMAATPADDPKMVGYEPPGGCTACEGTPFRSPAPQEPLRAADLADQLPSDVLGKLHDLHFRPADPPPAAVFEPAVIGSTLPPEQLAAAWDGVKVRREEMFARIRGELPPIETTVIRPTTTRLIGLTGRAGSGKNTVAAMIPGAVTVGLADPLYAMLAAMLGIPESVLRDRQVKEREIPGVGRSVRQLLQTLGTAWGRETVGSDVWVTMLSRRIDDLTRLGVGVIAVADVRFDNEARWIRERGGEVWYVDREPATAVDDHVSEAGIDASLVDVRIDNTGMPERTRAAVLAAYSQS